MTFAIDGGPAAGKTLRDYFAAQALVALGWPDRPIDVEEVAERCYVMADAMIRHRIQKPKTLGKK